MIGGFLVVLFGMVMGALAGFVVAAFMLNVESDAVLHGFMVAGAIIGGLNEVAKYFPGGGSKRK